MKNLVVAAPRSGTKCMSHFLRAHGLDMPHEAEGEDGAVGWIYAGEGRVFGKTIANVEADYVIHLVRHPLSCFRTYHTFTDESWDYIYENIGSLDHFSTLERYMVFWYEWNVRCEQMSHMILQIEDLYHNGNWDMVLTFFGLRDIPSTPVPVPKNINHRTRKDEVTWDMLFSINEKVAQNVYNKAVSYGYK